MIIANYEEHLDTRKGEYYYFSSMTTIEVIAHISYDYVLEFPIWFPSWFQDSSHQGNAIFFFFPNSLIIARLIIFLLDFISRQKL